MNIFDRWSVLFVKSGQIYLTINNHLDHMGLAYNVYKDIPIYISETSYKIIKASDEYKGNKTIKSPIFLKAKQVIKIGDISITPFLCDHSAYDSYMFLIESDNKSILYTGDFRSNGRKSFTSLLNQLPKKIDALICEGTTLTRADKIAKTEQVLEEEGLKLVKEVSGPVFVLMSSANIDRIVTMFRIAKRTNRIFLMELYMAEIANAIGGNIPNPIGFDNGVRVFITRSYNKEHFRYKIFNKYGDKKISKVQIAKSKFVMVIRSSMQNYLISLNKKMNFQGGVVIYSLWDGYKEKTDMKKLLSECEAMGLETINLHTTGHADANTIKKLIDRLNPTIIIPVHTENANWFKDHYGDKATNDSEIKIE